MTPDKMNMRVLLILAILGAVLGAAGLYRYVAHL